MTEVLPEFPDLDQLRRQAKELLHGAMTEMLQWLERGRLVAPVVTTFPLKHVADAHRAIESGQTTGKLVLLTADA